MTAFVVAVLGFIVLLAVIVRLALPVAERYERQQAMHRHPAGKHSHEYVHGGKP